MINETIVLAGIILIIIGIIGNKKIAVKEVTIGDLSMVQRSIVTLLGIFVLVGSFWPSSLMFLPPSTTIPAVTPTPTLTSIPSPTPTPFPSSTPSLTINITAPIDEEKVPRSIVVQGIILGEVPKDRYIWIVVHPHVSNGWYPQVKRVVPFGGKWSASAWIGLEGSVDIGKVYDILVVLVSKDSDQYYLNYLEEGSKTGNYPVIDLPTDAIVYDIVKVTRK